MGMSDISSLDILRQVTAELLSVKSRADTLESSPGMKEQTISLIALLRSAIYPHLFGGAEGGGDTLVIAVEYRLRSAARLLSQMFRYFAPQRDTDAMVAEFLRELPVIKTVLETDIKAAYDGDPAAMSMEEIMLAYPAFEAISIYRMAHKLYTMKVPMLPRMMTEYAHQITGIDIHPGAAIGEYFFIDHGTGVVIGETTTIGDHVKLYQGVTLGAKSFELDENGNPVKGIKRHPDIGSHVVIYAGATILGGTTKIGDNCVIGGNVWLTHSVESGHTVYAAEERGIIV